MAQGSTPGRVIPKTQKMVINIKLMNRHIYIYIYIFSSKCKKKYLKKRNNTLIKDD